jgi:sigma-B regulation protein RsbU (phosphoserine phosphatase)
MRYAGIIIIVAAAILLEVISAGQYRYMHNVLADELEHRAGAELGMKAIVLKSFVNMSERTLQGHLWDMKYDLATPDSMFSIASWMLKTNPQLTGCGIAFKPGYYPDRGELFEPYAIRQGDSIIVKQVAGPEHDYRTSGFYPEGVKKKKPCWVDPYIDDITKLRTLSFALPVWDYDHNFVAVFGLDVSLDWLGDTLNVRHIYPSSYDLLLSSDGVLLAGPAAEMVSEKKVRDIVALINDSTVAREKSQSGRSTVVDFVDEDGRSGMVFYSTFRGEPHWQMAVVCYDDEVYGPLYAMRRMVIIASIFGLLLLGLILFLVMRYFRRLEQANLRQENISNELRIARNIQMEMLPPMETAYADRDDVQLYSSLVPAKEVGGDLIDHFLRDEKLFFCIGDVSGKGVPSAMVMAVIHSLFRMASARENNPDRIMQTINEVACQNNRSNMFVTLFIGVLDLPTGHLRYCNAGHDVPVCMRQGADGLELECLPAKPNLPVGVFDDFSYEKQSVTLAPGETLFLYTDGLTEARSPVRDQFRMERTMEVLKGCGDMTPQQVIATMKAAVQAFVEDAPQSDDLTMMSISYTPVEHKTTLDETLELENDVRQVTALNDFVKRVSGQLNIAPSVLKSIRLAVEEAVVNVMDYAYPANVVGKINIRALSDGETLEFVISDSGVAFDPTEALKADTSLSANDRPIGGLGILLVRELMDSINYERINGRNVLTLKKKI